MPDQREDTTMTAPPSPPAEIPRCHCGREIRHLNPASPRPHCVGCGLPPEECTCTEERPGGGIEIKP